MGEELGLEMSSSGVSGLEFEPSTLNPRGLAQSCLRWACHPRWCALADRRDP